MRGNIMYTAITAVYTTIYTTNLLCILVLRTILYTFNICNYISYCIRRVLITTTNIVSSYYYLYIPAIPAGLYGGLGTHLLRVVPNTAILFFTYEKVSRFFVSEGQDL